MFPLRLREDLNVYTRHGGQKQRILVLVLSADSNNRNFTLLAFVQICSGVHPVTYPMGSWGKAAEA
jgi:hypothetical protein